MKCNLCGADMKSCKGWLERVNAKGVLGVYECRPVCGADLPLNERVLGAVEPDAAIDQARKDRV